MSDLREKKLIVSIIQFFRRKILSGELGPDQSESLEVAIQCLENGFSVDTLDPSLHTDVDLLSVYTSESENRQPTPQEKDEADRLKNVGNDLMKDGKYEEAIDSYSAAINLFRSPIFYCNRAAAYSKIEKHQCAVDDCKTALHLDPNYSKAFGRMGLAYSCMNRYSEARDAYKKALELEPNNDSFKNNLKIAEDKIEEMARQGRSGGMGGATAGFPGFPGAFNPFELLNNPGLVQMAQQFMSDPAMQNMMSSMMGMGVGGMGAAAPPPSSTSVPESNATSGQEPQSDPQQPGAPPPALNDLLQMGQRLAAQMQSQNPQLVEQLRRQFQGQNHPDDGSGDEPGNNQQPPPTS